MTARSRRRGRKGFALFLSLLLLLVLTISGVALMFNTTVEDTLSSVETKVSRTFYGADSGVEFAQAALHGPASGPLNGTGSAYVGGKVPENIATNIPGSTVKDIEVVVTPPVKLGIVERPGEQFDPSTQYGSPRIVEQLFSVTSTATSNTLQATKSINAQFSIYPWIATIDGASSGAGN